MSRTAVIVNVTVSMMHVNAIPEYGIEEHGEPVEYTVTYASGAVKYYGADKVPKTVMQWLEVHQTAPEPAPEATETMPEAPETAIQATEATEPINTAFVLIGAPYSPCESTTEPIQAAPAPEQAPETTAAAGQDPEPVRTVISPGAALVLTGLGAAWLFVSAGLYAVTLGSLAFTATQLVSQIIGQAYQIAKNRFIALASRTRSGCLAEMKRAKKATEKALKVGQETARQIYTWISAQARTGAYKSIQAGQGVKAWAVDAWEWRRQLIESETVIG